MGRVLIVGVGNTIMGDDGLGVYALNQLKSRELPEYVDTLEAGTALLDALPDLKNYDKMVLIDAVAADSRKVCVAREGPLLTRDGHRRSTATSVAGRRQTA